MDIFVKVSDVKELEGSFCPLHSIKEEKNKFCDFSVIENLKDDDYVNFRKILNKSLSDKLSNLDILEVLSDSDISFCTRGGGRVYEDIQDFITDNDAKCILSLFGYDFNKESFLKTKIPFMIFLYLEAGMDINAKNEEGETILFSLGTKDKDCVNVLVKKGADINIRNNMGLAPFIYSINLDVMKSFIENGADINSKCIMGNNALAYIDDIEKVKYLVESGIEINSENDSGSTALNYIDDEEIKSYLIDKGAKY